MVFWKKKQDDVVDLGSLYKRQKQRLSEMQEDMQVKGDGSDFVTYPATSPSSSSSSDGSALGFLGNLAGAGSTSESFPIESSSETETYGSSDTGEKRRKLAKRLMDMTTKLEDINNQIYHIQQRLEVIEAKMNRDY